MTNSPEFEVKNHLTAGQLLRQARLLAGVHLAVLSSHLKVPVRELEALEADELDPGKGPFFYRGLASSMCRQLNTDPRPILDGLPQLPGQLSARKTSKLPYDALLEGARRRPSFWQVFSAKVFWLGFLLFALTVSFLWMPSPSEWAIWDRLNLTLFNKPSSDQITQEDNLQTSPVPAPAIAPAAEGKDSSEAPAPSAPTSNALNPATVMPLMAADSPMKSANTGPSASPGTVPWVFRAKGESWLELRNTRDAVIWSGTLKEGDVIRIDSPLPVRVVVGRAQVVSATLRGQLFDLGPHTQLTVARFEVKD